jgi:hypothetical protein
VMDEGRGVADGLTGEILENETGAWIIKGVFISKTPLFVYFYAADFALRTGALRSLRRVPPTLPAIGLCVSTSSTTNPGQAWSLLVGSNGSVLMDCLGKYSKSRTIPPIPLYVRVK